MPLTGSSKITVRPRGGVQRVGLALARDVAGAPGPASGFSEYAFREDRAHYSAALTGEPFRRLTRHTLTMELPATASVEQLCAADGLVARIEMASGEVVVAGWSERFANAYPLRLTALETTSGSAPGDYPTIKLTLECYE